MKQTLYGLFTAFVIAFTFTGSALGFVTMLISGTDALLEHRIEGLGAWVALGFCTTVVAYVAGGLCPEQAS